ncbi:MAG: thiamine pyrophosphate-binding protein [Lachnospiraceae bacterium]|nr:thiamine pyrophosphate-binding protein [Lachnospiraceae bacterium]
MKIRVAEYIAEYLYEKGIRDVFTVVGGGAMYLNNAFGQSKKLRTTYTHHEQAAAIAAEGYAKASGKIATVCVTTGPGGTNALTGVLCAYQDNVPMLVISGQVRYATTVESTGLDLRQMGEQEYHIVQSVKPMTKYAVMVKNPLEIKRQLDKALYIAYDGRRGPCWLDIPLDVQGAFIETEDLLDVEEYAEPHYEINKDLFIETLKQAKKPVILAGTAVRGTGNVDLFKDFAKRVNVPVLAATTVADLFEVSHENYFGNFGSFGGRAGNFIVQNADLIIAIGCRMTFKHTGFDSASFAPNAKKIVVDIDENELKKNVINIDLPIKSDIKFFLNQMMDLDFRFENDNWLNYCRLLKKKFPQYRQEFEKPGKVNPYYLRKEISKFISDDNITIVGNSVACVSVLQMGVEKNGQRMYGNINCGTMGYDLPAAEGAARAMNQEVLCITGDGSIQMNIQELQTIKHNNLPVKIFIFNNFGYQAIMQTQTNFFQANFSGCTKESGISMPSFEKLAYAYDFPFVRISSNEEVDEKLKEVFSHEGYVLCEVMQDTEQNIEPKVKSKQRADGKLYSTPLDDLFPFLPEEEYEKCQYKEDVKYEF